MHIFAECPVIITDIVEARLHGDIADFKSGIPEQPGAFIDSVIVQIIHRSRIGHLFEKTA